MRKPWFKLYITEHAVCTDSMLEKYHRLFRTTPGIDYNWCRRYIRLCIRWGLHKQKTSLRQLNMFGLHWKQHSILHHETSFNVHRNKEVETTLTYRGNHPLWRCLGNASLIPMLNRNGNDGDKWIGHGTGIRSNPIHNIMRNAWPDDNHEITVDSVGENAMERW
jgi:hypothetical protein